MFCLVKTNTKRMITKDDKFEKEKDAFISPPILLSSQRF